MPLYCQDWVAPSAVVIWRGRSKLSSCDVVTWPKGSVTTPRAALARAGLLVLIHWAGQPRFPVDSDPNPFVRVDFNKCIHCTRCVRACEEIQGRFVWGVGYRGGDTKIVAGANTNMLDARCESCGACVAYCPTGALDDKMAVGRPGPAYVGLEFLVTAI